ncbi:MAG: mdtA 2 [Pedosphaera sp.]|nr:mdtA 2 [Pedosphaera sp.]
MNAPKTSLDDLRIERNDAPARRSNRWLWPLLLFALIVAISAVLWFTHSQAIEVTTAPVRAITSGDAERIVLNASGYVTARRKATISAKITGKVAEVLIEEGMRVKAGQVLARLDNSNLKTSLDVAESQLDSARLNLDETRALLKQADNEFRRATQLANQNIASQSDLDKAESDAVSIKARLARQEQDVTVAERQVAMWKQQLDDAIICAPFDGVVTSKDVQPGEMISPVSAGGGFTRTGVCTIVDMESLEIEIDVNESYINRVAADQPVEATLDAYTTWKIPCKVIAIIPTADRQKSTVKVRVGFDKLDPRILPEMGVKVAFRETGGSTPTAARTMLTPKTAIQQQGGRDVVLVVQNGVVERRAVTVSGSDGDDVLISAGVADGERVVVLGPKDLTDGAKVKEKKP